MAQTRMNNSYLALPLRSVQELKRKWTAFQIELEREAAPDLSVPFQRLLRGVSSCLEEMEPAAGAFAPHSYVYHFDGRARSSMARLSSSLDQIARHLRLKGAEIRSAPRLRFMRIREEFGEFLDSVKRANRKRPDDLHRRAKFQERALIFPIAIGAEATS